MKRGRITHRRALCVFLFFVIFASGIVFAESDPKENQPRAAGPPEPSELTPDLLYDEALGFFGGTMSGIGLSYHKTNGTTGWQAVAGALYSPEISWGSDLLFYNVGLTHLWKVYSNAWREILAGNLYIFTSIMHDGRIPRDYDVVETGELDSGGNPLYEDVVTVGDYTPRITLGFGIGIEIIGFEHFSIPVEVGYGFSWLPTAGDIQDQFLIDLYPQIGFRYRY